MTTGRAKRAIRVLAYVDVDVDVDDDDDNYDDHVTVEPPLLNNRCICRLMREPNSVR